jgi:DNA-binding transcriptional ArsR family regulator
MQELLYIDEFEKASALLQPLRLELLKRMAEPRTCTELAESIGETPQKVYYHVKILEAAGIVEKISERRVRGTIEGKYRARAHAYWLSPHLVGKVGGRQRARDRMSLDFLLTLAEELQEEVGKLSQGEPNHETHSLGISADIFLRDANERSAFAQELQDMFQALARKYGSQERDSRTDQGQGFRVLLACYPKLSETQRSNDE